MAPGLNAFKSGWADLWKRSQLHVTSHNVHMKLLGFKGSLSECKKIERYRGLLYYY